MIFFTMFINQTNHLIKNLFFNGRAFVSINSNLTPLLIRSISSNNSPLFTKSHLSTGLKTDFSSAPKRSTTVFGVFMKTYFPTLPNDMPIKEKFERASLQWKNLTEDEKKNFKKVVTDSTQKYHQDMAAYMASLSPEEVEEYAKQKKEKIRNKTRRQIKIKLRKLNYPKRPMTSYILFYQEELAKRFPNGYPGVKSSEHIEMVRECSNIWKNMSSEEKAPYEQQAEIGRKRYYEQLEEWKNELGSRDNEEELKDLERLSRKFENTKISDVDVKIHQKNVAKKVIISRKKKSKENEKKQDDKGSELNTS